MTLSSSLDKTPLKSKKFIAYLFSTLVLAGLAVVALFTQTFGWPMVTFMSICAFGIVFNSTGYILKVAALDKLIRGIGLLSSKIPQGGDDESS